MVTRVVKGSIRMDSFALLWVVSARRKEAKNATRRITRIVADCKLYVNLTSECTEGGKILVTAGGG